MAADQKTIEAGQIFHHYIPDVFKVLPHHIKMKNIILFLVMAVLLAAAAAAQEIILVEPYNNTQVDIVFDTDTSFMYFIKNFSDVMYCRYYLDNLLVQADYNVEDDEVNIFMQNFSMPQAISWQVRCSSYNDTEINSSIFNNTIAISQHFAVGTCPASFYESFLLVAMIIISFVLIVTGIISGAGAIGFFGSLLLLVMSWYISGCIAIAGMIIAMISIVLMVRFVVLSKKM